MAESELTEKKISLTQNALVEDEELQLEIKKAELRASQNKWKKKKFMLLSLYIIAMGYGIGAMIFWISQYRKFTSPPTNLSNEASRKAIIAFAGMFILAFFGFIILYFRISNMFIGIMFMFMIVLVLTYGMIATSKSFYSLANDNTTHLIEFYTTTFKKDNAIPTFYRNIQKTCECCGFMKTDRLLEWPKKLNTIDFPKSCCMKSVLDVNRKSCQGLAYMYNKRRIPSGFTIIAKDEVMHIWKNRKGAPNNEFPLSGSQQTIYTNEMQNYFVEFSKEVLDEAVSPGKGLELEFYDRVALRLRSEISGGEKYANTGPKELYLKYDLYVDELIHKKELQRGQWLYFEIQVEPEKVHVNIDASATFEYKVYYATQGLSENVLLDEVIWPKRCSNFYKEDEPKCDYFGVKNKVTKILHKNPLKNSYLFLLRKIMLWNGILCSIDLFMLILLAIVFWYFYSRLKEEEIAALSLPSDFDLLNLDTTNYDDLDEASNKKLVHRRLKAKHERNKHRQGRKTKNTISTHGQKSRATLGQKSIAGQENRKSKGVKSKV